MRNIVMGICSLGIFFLVLMIGLTISGRQKRASELDTALNLAMEQALQMLVYNDDSGPKSDEELCAVFENLFLAQLSANASYQIEVLDVSAQRGILSVRVTETYAHLNGRTGHISLQKMAVCDQVTQEDLYGKRNLTFYVGEQIYRQYELDAGSALTVPRTPFKDNEVFAGWQDMESKEAYAPEELGRLILQGNMEFYALWEPIE